MKLTLLAAISLFALASCGPGKTGGHKNPPTVIPPVEQNASIFSKFTSSAGLHGINDLDFSSLQKNVPVDVTSECTGTSYGNSGDVNGVAEGFFEVQGDETAGFLQYGHLPYLNPLDNLCKALSKERYIYKVTGTVLNLCMVNYLNTDGSYKYCADYTLVE